MHSLFSVSMISSQCIVCLSGWWISENQQKCGHTLKAVTVISMRADKCDDKTLSCKFICNVFKIILSVQELAQKKGFSTHVAAFKSTAEEHLPLPPEFSSLPSVQPQPWWYPHQELHPASSDAQGPPEIQRWLETDMLKKPHEKQRLNLRLYMWTN